MNCEQAETLLAAYVFGEVEGTPADELREHVERCDTCAATLRDFRAAAALLEESLAGAPAPELSAARQKKLAGLTWTKKRDRWSWLRWLRKPVRALGQRIPRPTVGGPWRALATAGVCLLVCVVLAGLFLPALGTARHEARRTRSASNLKQIVTGTEIWTANVDVGEQERLPPSLESLAKDGILPDDRVFLNPRGGRIEQGGGFTSDYDSIMDRAGRQLSKSEVTHDTPLVWEKTPGRDGRNVAFGDSHVEFVPEERFQKLMKDVDRRFGGGSDTKYAKAGKKPDKLHPDAKKAAEPTDRAEKSKAEAPEEEPPPEAAAGEIVLDKSESRHSYGYNKRQGSRSSKARTHPGRRFGAKEIQSEVRPRTWSEGEAPAAPRESKGGDVRTGIVGSNWADVATRQKEDGPGSTRGGKGYGPERSAGDTANTVEAGERWRRVRRRGDPAAVGPDSRKFKPDVATGKDSLKSEDTAGIFNEGEGGDGDESRRVQLPSVDLRATEVVKVPDGKTILSGGLANVAEGVRDGQATVGKLGPGDGREGRLGERGRELTQSELDKLTAEDVERYKKNMKDETATTWKQARKQAIPHTVPGPKYPDDWAERRTRKSGTREDKEGTLGWGHFGEFALDRQGGQAGGRGGHVTKAEPAKPTSEIPDGAKGTGGVPVLGGLFYKPADPKTQPPAKGAPPVPLQPSEPKKGVEDTKWTAWEYEAGGKERDLARKRLAVRGELEREPGKATLSANGTAKGPAAKPDEKRKALELARQRKASPLPAETQAEVNGLARRLSDAESKHAKLKEKYAKNAPQALREAQELRKEVAAPTDELGRLEVRLSDIERGQRRLKAASEGQVELAQEAMKQEAASLKKPGQFVADLKERVEKAEEMNRALSLEHDERVANRWKQAAALHKQADEAIARGDLNKGMSVLEQGITTFKNVDEGAAFMTKAADLCRRQGDLARAANLYKNALELHPKSPAAANARKALEAIRKMEDPPKPTKPPVVRVNPFVMTQSDNQSTFALESDTGSYSQTRAHIRGGKLPPKHIVRVEEFVNAFDYNYPGNIEDAFSIHTTCAPSPFRDNLFQLKVGVRAKRAGRDGQRRNNLVLCIDTSSSMGTPGRLPLAQKAAAMLVNNLADADRVAVVAYGTRARLVLDTTPIKGNKRRILTTVNSLQSNGATNVAQGLAVAYLQTHKTFRSGDNNMVVHVGDGIANIGPDDARDILRNVENDRRQGITLTNVGVGTGQYNDQLMEQLANKGDGRYVFLDTEAEAERVFVDEIARLQMVAKDAKIQVEFDPGVVRRYRLLGYESRDIADRDFRNDAVDAGEIGSGQSATAVYELELLKAKGRIGVVRVRYHDIETGKVEEIASEMRAEDVVRRGRKTPPRYRLAACAAQFAEILRGSPYADPASIARLEHTLAQVCSELPLDDRAAELLGLVRTAKTMLAGR